MRLRGRFPAELRIMLPESAEGGGSGSVRQRSDARLDSSMADR